MQLTSRFNKGFRFLTFVIDIFSKYAWVVPLKDKKSVSIVHAFQSIFENSIENQIRYGLTKGVSFITILLKVGCKAMILLCIQHIMKENLLLLKYLLGH